MIEFLKDFGVGFLWLGFVGIIIAIMTYLTILTPWTLVIPAVLGFVGLCSLIGAIARS